MSEPNRSLTPLRRAPAPVGYRPRPSGRALAGLRRGLPALLRTLAPSALLLAAVAPPAGAWQEVQPNRGTRPTLSEGLRSSLERAEARADDWTSERVGERIAQVASALAEVWSSAESVSDAGLTAFAEEWLVADFRMLDQSAQIDDPSGARADEPLLARSGPDGSQALEPELGRAAFCRSLSRLARLLGDERHLKIKVVAVEALGEPAGTQRSRMVMTASGVRAGEWRQLNAHCSASWRSSADSTEWLEWSIEEAELVRGPAAGGPLFVDATRELLELDVASAERLGESLNSLRARTDRRLGAGLLGHHGVAVGDLDGDGIEDLYLPQPGGVPNLLLLADADGHVHDVGEGAGVAFLDMSRSALLLDLDADSDLDLVVSVGDEILFLENDGQAHFTLLSSQSAPNATSLCAADIDLDGDLDLYVCSYVSVYDDEATPLPYHDANNGQPNLLFLNTFEESGRERWDFVDVTSERGLDANNRRFSFAAAWEDYDRDGDPDLYVANDFGRNNLYRNTDGHFEDVAAEAGVEDISAGMGVSWGDVDGDGWMDLYVSNMWSSAGQRIAYQERFQRDSTQAARAAFQRHARGNSLFRNLGDGRFEDISQAAGVSLGRWAWGAIFVDLDDDPRRDLFVPNGFVTGGSGADL